MPSATERFRRIENATECSQLQHIALVTNDDRKRNLKEIFVQASVYNLT
jgi:hypothetical protein